MSAGADEAYVVLEPRAPEVPLLVSIPHTGTDVPGEIAGRFAGDTVRALPDTDWHLHELYSFVPDLGARVLHARASRYVVDLNRPKDRQPLYPGRDETGLVPTSTFDGEPIYAGDPPGEDEIAARVAAWWEPYHAHLRAELGLLRARFGYALLWDAHSIRSRVPRFFDGPLPGFVLGDRMGGAAHPALSRAVAEVLGMGAWRSARNEPFQGGYITRHYGRPAEHVHALQLEMAQVLYMDEEPPFSWDGARANEVRPVLRQALEAFLAAGERLYSGASPV